MTLSVIWAAKAAGWLSRLLGRGTGAALPGLIAERLDPGILAKLGRGLGDGCVMVTGTNGKTTTTRMLAAVMERVGQRVLTNPTGSNLTRGIVSALIGRADWRGRIAADLGVFEVDEASLPAAAAALRPKAVVVLNLFRDQLDRYGELDSIARLLGRALAGLEADIWLNADDPLVAGLASGVKQGRVRYFGLEEAPVRRLAHDWTSDSDRCPVGGEALTYAANFYSHIGHWSCPSGHVERPTPNLAGRVSKDFTLTIEGQSVRLAAEGLYLAYNQLAALAAAGGLGVPIGEAAEVLGRTKAALGRVERFDHRGRRVTILLIKNPAGFNQVIQTFLLPERLPRPAGIMIAVNDNLADGRDVSWLWDAAFEEIGEASLVASGIRAADLALRLKYAGRAAEAEPDLARAFGRLVEQVPEGGQVFVLPTYTAMGEFRRRLKLGVDS